MGLLPHPANELADRISALEARASAAGIHVQRPGGSLGGAWEAQHGDEWAIVCRDPSEFADALEARLKLIKARRAGGR